MSKRPKKSSIRHTRAIERDQSKHQSSGPPAEAIEQRLEALIHPATYSQIELFQSMGLRAGILSLPVMMAFVVSLIWRQIGAVGEAVRVLNQEGMLWVSATVVSQAAVTQRLNTLPAVLFENVLKALLPKMADQWARRSRPLPGAVAFVQQRFSQVLVLDCSTLDALLRKTGLLQATASNPLAGRIAAVLDVVTRLPIQLCYEPDEQAHDQRFWLSVLNKWVTNCLVLFDSGFLNFEVFDQLTRAGRWFITRPKSNTVYQVTAVLRRSAAVHDYLIELGAPGKHCQERMRLVECLWHGKWYRYLTNVTDPLRLPPEVILAVYAQRWHIEDAFNLVKRLLGLAYFWTGALNGLLVQIWATWVLFAVLLSSQIEFVQSDRLFEPTNRVNCMTLNGFLN